MKPTTEMIRLSHEAAIWQHARNREYYHFTEGRKIERREVAARWIKYRLVNPNGLTIEKWVDRQLIKNGGNLIPIERSI